MAYGNIMGRHRAICCPRFRTDHFGVTFICPEFRTRHYTPCNNLSQFWHCHCHLCNVMPQISDKLMHTGHFRVPDFRRSYCTPGNIVSEFSNVIAYRATSCPRFRADFCTVGSPCPKSQAGYTPVGGWNYPTGLFASKIFIRSSRRSYWWSSMKEVQTRKPSCSEPQVMRQMAETP